MTGDSNGALWRIWRDREIGGGWRWAEDPRGVRWKTWKTTVRRSERRNGGNEERAKDPVRVLGGVEGARDVLLHGEGSRTGQMSVIASLFARYRAACRERSRLKVYRYRADSPICSSATGPASPHCQGISIVHYLLQCSQDDF
jgi:hypothetical protein